MDFENLPIISVSKENLEEEHICCAMSDKKSSEGVSNKKALMNSLFSQGYKFKKADIRGKVFIEYMPAEIALRPVVAPGYWFIQCLWVSGKYKGHGLSTKLLNCCIEDARDSNGIVVVTSSKPFLNDKKYFIHHGFEVCDKAPPHFELLVKKNKAAPSPYFTERAKKNTSSFHDGVLIEFTDQCPFTEFYVKLLEDVCEKESIPFKSRKLSVPEEIQNATSAYGTFSLFDNGKFKTHMIPTEKQFLKLLD